MSLVLVVVVAVVAAALGLALGLGLRRPRHTVLVGDGWHMFHAELDRSRRYERPFALARFECRDLEPDGEEGARVRGAVGSALRTVDAVWTEGPHVYALLPECTRAEGRALVERLEASSPEVLQPGSAQVVCFPDDGLTTGALLALFGKHDVPNSGVPSIGRSAATTPDGPTLAAGEGVGTS